MKNFKKIINPCTNEVYIYNDKERPVNSFCKIEYQDGQLSITGVIGPKSNGNSWGSCGQCSEEVRTGTPTKNWTNEMLQKFCDIWDKMAEEKVEVKTYKLTRETREKQNEAKNRALKCLTNHEPFFPTLEETKIYNLPFEKKSYNGSEFSDSECYEYTEKNCLGYSNIDHKIRGHINYSENELGLLGRKCLICGYKYGHGWLKEEIPQDVIDFLTNLPKSNKVPAWI